MYGLGENKKDELCSTFSLYSEIIQINDIENETIGYNGAYKVYGKEKVAVIPLYLMKFYVLLEKEFQGNIINNKKTSILVFCQ